jgi:NSS family neurotransmitter:Na+ symporter
MKQQREHWGTKIGFLMATAGSAVGLGSLWRFPYVTGQNGGGAFVLLYIFFTLIIGIPVFMSELLIGRTSQKSAVLAYTDLSHGSSHWKLLGWLNLITCFIILSYYSVISGWTLNYSVMSLNNFTANRTPEEIKNIFNILFKSGDINVFWHLIFMLMTVGVVYCGVRKGIEYWSKILTPALFVILVGMFIYASTLSGFSKAVKFILYPDFTKITATGILTALGMSLFTLSGGLGIILTYGSYLKKTDDIPKTGLIIGSVSVLVSIFAALMIFPIVFTFNFEPQAGPGLVFQTLPVLFSKLPGTLILSTIFFILFVFATLTSAISLLEVIVANLIEIFEWTRTKAVLLAGLFAFIVGIPTALAGSDSLFKNWSKMYGGNFFDTVNNITASWMMPIAAFLTVLFVSFVMKKQFSEQELMQGTKLKSVMNVWFFLVRYIAPIAIFIIILQESGVINLSKLFK